MASEQSNVLALPTASASELRAQELLAALPVAVYTTDHAGFITAYNEAAVRLWGVRPILGEARWCGSARILDVDGNPMPHDECPMALALRYAKDVAGAEAVAERPDGTRIPFLAFPVVLRDTAGNITGAVNTLVDISELKQVQEAQYRLAAIVHSSTDAIISKSLDGIIRTWNAGAERVFGYEADEVVGKSITVLIPDDRLTEEEMILQRIRRGEEVDHFESLRKRKDGKLIPVSLNISPVRADNGKIIGASKIARDISEQKEAEQRIQTLMREVNHRVKNQFAVILSMTREVGKQLGYRKEFDDLIEQRILALARSHDLLIDGNWKGATIFELLLAHLKIFAPKEQVTLSGPTLTLGPMAVQYLGMAFHELATNSTKYGAFSEAGGAVTVEWKTELDAAGKKIFVLRWQEKTSCNVQVPERRGFGSTVLERVAPAAVEGEAKLSFLAGGLMWELRAPCASLKGPST